MGDGPKGQTLEAKQGPTMPSNNFEFRGDQLLDSEDSPRNAPMPETQKSAQRNASQSPTKQSQPPTNAGLMDLDINAFDNCTNAALQDFHALQSAETKIKSLDEKKAKDLHIQDEKMQAREIVEASIQTWAYPKMNPKQMNGIRILLSTMENIVWDGSNWEPVNYIFFGKQTRLVCMS